MEALNQFVGFVISHRDELLEQTLEHLMLTLVSLFFATAIGLSLGIFITKKAKFSRPVLSVVNAVQTIPSIALLGFLLPFLGIGIIPAIVALFLYALLPIVRNTYAGISKIDPEIIESAMGMGMNPKQQLLQVELPLAMPVIFAGIRTAFVINVGVATLCALIAAGGLGEFIFRGLSTNNPYMIMAGAIPAASMALFFDWLMGRFEKSINRLIKPVLIVAILIMMALVLSQVSLSEHRFSAGFPSEFIERGDGYRGLSETYNLDLEIHEMEIGLMYDAVKNGDVDVISGFSTDGRIKAFNLKLLEDDKSYFPPYHAAPLVRQEVADRFPKVVEALNLLHNRISDTTMARLNYLVDEKKQDINEVARNFVEELGFSARKIVPGTTLKIGSKNFTESFILANIFEVIIENYAGVGVELKQGFGGTKLVFDALNTGEIDVYPEYTGTGLLVILNTNNTDLIDYQRDKVYDYVQKRFKEDYGLLWLKPLGFNNTFALMMRQEQADLLGIQRISDLNRP